MKTWHINLALEAEKAANFCIACGQYGHYPVECCPQLAEPKERSFNGYACFLCFVIGLVVGCCVTKGFM
jgi:hypothetical protein